MPALHPSLSTALEIDHALAEMEREVNLLLNLTPVNSAQAWTAFERSAFKQVPVLQSRPLAFAPDVVRRRLYDLEMERLQDPALEPVRRQARRDQQTDHASGGSRHGSVPP